MPSGYLSGFEHLGALLLGRADTPARLLHFLLSAPMLCRYANYWVSDFSKNCGAQQRVFYSWWRGREPEPLFRIFIDVISLDDFAFALVSVVWSRLPDLR